MTITLPDLRERLIRAMEGGGNPSAPHADRLLASPEWAEVEAELLAAGEARGLERAARTVLAVADAFDKRHKSEDWINANGAREACKAICAISISPALVAVPKEEWERMRQCIAFFASAIKGGERWSDTCEQEMRAALGPKP